ncbi:hypothetical protein D3C78_1198430 [compost metagenome]
MLIKTAIFHFGFPGHMAPARPAVVARAGLRADDGPGLEGAGVSRLRLCGWRP